MKGRFINSNIKHVVCYLSVDRILEIEHLRKIIDEERARAKV